MKTPNGWKGFCEHCSKDVFAQGGSMYSFGVLGPQTYWLVCRECWVTRSEWCQDIDPEDDGSDQEEN